MHASVNIGYQGKSGPGKIHEVILVFHIQQQLNGGRKEVKRDRNGPSL